MALMTWADKCFRITLNWLKLSNSGDTLKLMVPNHSRKAMSGWTNHPCTVISHKKDEKKMGYRGSKSEINHSVKEQRVDGSWCRYNHLMNVLHLRCTLMGFERNYQVKILTKQFNNRKFSTAHLALDSKPSSINPWFITGFSDAESSFIVSIYQDKNSKLKWRVSPCFSIHIHNKDIELLESIRDFLGVGKVRKNSEKTAIFRVDNIQDLQVIIDHFDKYPLVGDKVSDYLLFKQCYNLIKQKKHLTPAGFNQILALKYNLNKGFNDDFKKRFPNIKPVNRPKYIFKGIPNPHWISGFVSGDSTFSVSIEKGYNKIGKRVRLIFGTCLHNKDTELLIGISNYFYNLSGLTLETVSKEYKFDRNKYIHITEKTALLQIKNFSDIVDKVIPFFDKYPVLGVKSLDFTDFKKVAGFMQNKEHLTDEGLTEIIKIVEGMNLDRVKPKSIEDKT